MGKALNPGLTKEKFLRNKDKENIPGNQGKEKFLRNIDKHLDSDSPAGPGLSITWEILGMDDQMDLPSSYLEVIRLIDEGVKKATVERFSRNLKIPMTSIAPLLNMSYKTLTRKKGSEKLDSSVSSLVFELASTYGKAFEVFRDRDKVNRWFNKSNKALNGGQPFRLLHTPTGIKLVNQVLGRIEEGVYS